MTDYISREAVLSLAKDVTLGNGCKHRCIDATQIYEIPSADVREVVHGDSIGELDPRDQFVCSICGIELQD